MPGKVDGSHVLYHFLQKDLLVTDIWLFQMLVARLIASLGIWLHPSTYKRLPVLLPFAVRDPSCRRRKPGDEEQWGSPNAQGYFRDDNSLIKKLPSGLRIASPLEDVYHDRMIGNGFVAAHVWRGMTATGEGGLASRDPWTYSFVPNLVWLPAQVAKLTDREGSFTQLYLQALSAKIYRDADVTTPVREYCEKCWSKLPVPKGIPEQGLPDVTHLSFFGHDERFIARRCSTIEGVSTALAAVASGGGTESKIISSRYTAGIKQLPHRVAGALSEELSMYLQAVRATRASA